MKRIFLIALALSMSSCASTAGPYVTSISSDGDGGLIVEKCMVKYDRFSAAVSSSDCHSSNMRMGSGKRTPASE